MNVIASIKTPRRVPSNLLSEASARCTLKREALRFLLVELQQLLAFGTGALEIGIARLGHHDVAHAAALGLVGHAHVDLARGLDEIERRLLRGFFRLLGLRPYLVERFHDGVAMARRKLAPPAPVG